MPAQVNDELYAERSGIPGKISINDILQVVLANLPVDITVSDTAPPNPSINDLWVDTS